ncbi:MAG: ATP-binding protein [Thermoleophilaceae bacterium]
MKRESWLPAAPESAPLARAIVREAARQWGLDGEAAWDLVLATSEAVANAVVHGDACRNGDEGIRLRVELRDDEVLVEVLDCGVFEGEPQSTAAEVTYGRGIPIIEAVTDHFELVPGPRRTLVRFGKRSALAAV